MITPTVILLSLASVATAVISGVVGMAGGITLLSLMTFFMPLWQIIPVHGLVQLTSNSSRCFLLRKSIRRDILGYFCIGAPIGALIAYLIIKEITHKSLFLIPVALVIFYTLFKPKKLPAINLPPVGFIGLGVVVGIMSPLMGATGPLLAPFFLRDNWEKEEIVATKAATQMLTHLLKIPIFYAISFDYSQFIPHIILMSLGAVIGTKLGVMLLGKTSEAVFKKIYQIALFIAGIRILSKIFLV